MDIEASGLGGPKKWHMSRNSVFNPTAPNQLITMLRETTPSSMDASRFEYT